MKNYLYRREFLKIAGFGLASAALPGCRGEMAQMLPEKKKRPNVIFVLTDDQRYDCLGCSGNEFIKTPNIDRLASEGVFFENAFVTSAACTPSRTCFLTGQWERKHGVNFGSESAMAEQAFDKTYPMILKKKGYFTGYVGKNHTPVGPGGYKGGMMEKKFDYWYGNHGHSKFYPKRKHEIYKNAKADTQVEIFEEGAMNFLQTNEDFAKGAINFLQERPKHKPFCLEINFNVPHSAGTLSMKQLPGDPELYRTAYRNIMHKFPMPETYTAEKDIKKPKIPRDVYNGKYISSYNYVKTPESMREQLVRVYQTVTGVDRLVGNLRSKLDEMGLADNTIIIFTSDHGIQFGEHGLGGKVLLYDQSIHIPLIIYDPRLSDSTREKRIDALVVEEDVAPTLLRLAGLKVPDSMQGKSLVPLIMGKKVNWRQDFFCENLFTGQNYPRCEAVRSKKWKYVRYFKRTDPLKPYAESLTASIKGEKPIYEELYNLKTDPYEEHNLAADEHYSEVLKRLRQRCQKLVTQAAGTGQPLVVSDSRRAIPRKK